MLYFYNFTLIINLAHLFEPSQIFNSQEELKDTAEGVNTMHIHEFQETMKRVFFHRDSERGVKGTYEWLVDEVTELGEAIEGDDLKAAEKEFADVIAWLASLANITGIDLEKAASEKYRGKCPKCQKEYCQCTF